MMKSELLSIQTLIQNYFLQRLMQQRKVSYHTVCSYKDAFRLYLRYLEDVHGISATKVSINHFDLEYLQCFCKYLEEKRKNKPVTINNRMAAIKSFMQYVAETAPEYSAISKRALMLPELEKKHPRTKPEKIEQMARDKQMKYAERQLRERAKTIAQTERAFAYEYGRYQHTKNLVDQGILPPQDKKWSATDSENTCSTCRELNGKVVGMDEEFAPGKLLPPLHPRCKCCVMYVNSKSMTAAYETEEDELREYSTEEIETHANKMSEIADKHLDLESSWSGKVVVDDDSGVYGIQWNGDIITRHETAPHILLHEQLHARSVTKYDHKMYKQYENMEEGSVQFAAQEISKKENIQILESQYDHMTEALRNINKVAGLFKNDYDFAMKLISVPLPDRYDWLNNMIYDKMMLSGNIEDYQKVSHWMEALENGKTS